MDKPKKEKKKKGTGTYIAGSSGNVLRTYPNDIGSGANYEEVDTTGYSAGKKKFKKKEGYMHIGSLLGPSLVKRQTGTSTVDRKDVPNLLKRFKKGSSKKIDNTQNLPEITVSAKKVKTKPKVEVKAKAAQAVKNALKKLQSKIAESKNKNK